MKKWKLELWGDYYHLYRREWYLFIPVWFYYHKCFSSIEEGERWIETYEKKPKGKEL